jgi:hypothetical protein
VVHEHVANARFKQEGSDNKWVLAKNNFQLPQVISVTKEAKGRPLWLNLAHSTHALGLSSLGVKLVITGHNIH